jgi:hypothetical protein
MEQRDINCTRCGCVLILGNVDDSDDGIDRHYYCPNCGMVIEIYTPDEVKDKPYVYDNSVKDEISIYDSFCSVCGHKIKVSGNGCLSDRIETIECGGDDDKISIDYHECENCGRSEIRWDNSENEKGLFRYWNQRCRYFDDAIAKVKHYSETMGVSVNPMELVNVKSLIIKEHKKCRDDFNYWCEKYVKYND